MEAKDTVMSIGEEYTLRKQWEKLDANTRIAWRDYWLEAQAEKSFKAGQDSVFESMPDNLPPLLETAHRSGIRGMVEFVEQEGVMYQYGDTLKRWQAQLKRWGIKEVKDVGDKG